MGVFGKERARTFRQKIFAFSLIFALHTRASSSLILIQYIWRIKKPFFSSEFPIKGS